MRASGAHEDAQQQSAPPVKILIVDDEANLAEAVALAVRFEGWQARIVGTGSAALREFRVDRPDLIVLDVMLPDIDGFTFLARLRGAGHDVPVVMLTARDATQDRITGLRHGADDYLVKPFSLEELVERIKAVLRRGALLPARSEHQLLQLADLQIDLDSHDVTRGNEPIYLTATEFELLRFLVVNSGTVLSKSQILDHVWHYGFAGNGNIVELYVGYLRRKLEAHGPRLIHTVRGFGYLARAQDLGAA